MSAQNETLIRDFCAAWRRRSIEELVGFFTPVMAVVLLALPTFLKVLPALQKPKPAERPADFPDGQGGWPLYFAPMAFWNNRSFGSLFMLGLLVDVLLRVFLPAFWR